MSQRLDKQVDIISSTLEIIVTNLSTQFPSTVQHQKQHIPEFPRTSILCSPIKSINVFQVCVVYFTIKSEDSMTVAEGVLNTLQIDSGDRY